MTTVASPSGFRFLARGHVLLGLAVAAIGASAALDAWTGRNILPFDNDAMLRMVQVRDLIGGQGWFDLVQRRLGMPGGFEMHWSRLVDAPIAALILLAQAAGLSTASAESFAAAAWPGLCGTAALLACMMIARSLGGLPAALLALLIGFATFSTLGRFSTGALDHHGPQIALCIIAAAMFARQERRTVHGVVAGACAALMAAIGIETNLHVVVLGAAAALLWLWKGEEHRAFAFGFGVGFAASCAGAFALAVPASSRFAAVCDAYSVSHALPATIAGLALAVAARLAGPTAPFIQRLAMLGGVGAVTVAAAFPYSLACIKDPLADLDPLLKTEWLATVSEAMPLPVFLATDPMAAMAFGMPALLALGVGLRMTMVRKADGAEWIIPTALIALSVVMSFYQFRAIVLAAHLAVPVLAAFVASVAAPLWSGLGSGKRLAASIIAGFATIPMGWALMGAILEPLIAPASRLDARDHADNSSCSTEEAVTLMRAMPPAFFFNVSNIGAPILFHTNHRALAGPYHRNGEGLKRSILAFSAPSAEAQRIVLDSGASHLVWCKDAFDAKNFADKGGLAADLNESRTPDWLEPEAATVDGRFSIYRILR